MEGRKYHTYYLLNGETLILFPIKNMVEILKIKLKCKFTLHSMHIVIIKMLL